MSEPVSRSLVEAFYAAYASRDPARILELLADDVEWRFLGPVEIFPFCGLRRGKAAAIEHFTRLVPSVFSVARFEPEETVIDGDRAATFSRLTAVHKVTGRTATYHCAHFVTFRDGKVAAVQSVADTFSVIEQLLDAEFILGAPPLEDTHGDLVAL